MFNRSINRRTFVSAAAASALVTGLGARPAFGQDKPTIGVGSKQFTEQLIVGNALALMLEDAGFETDRRLNLGGTAIAHEALVNGDIDTYIEYTGTALLALLDEELPDVDEADADEATPDNGIVDPAYDIVAERYPEEFGVEWLEPWGFNNTYAIAIPGDTADELGLETTSDLAEHAGDLVLGTDQEFPIRPDGLPGFEERYGFGFKDVVIGDIGLMYNAVDKGDVDIITAYATDGRIAKLGLVLLEDDLSFFPPYYGAPIVRQEVLEEHPDIADILNQPAGLIDNELMGKYNLMVDDGEAEPEEAARLLLAELEILDAE